MRSLYGASKSSNHKSCILITGCVHLDNSRRRSGNRLGYVGRIKISPLNEYISVYPLYYVSTCFKRDNLSARWKPYGRNFHLNINRIRAAATHPDLARCGLANLRRALYCKSLSALFKIAEVVYMKSEESCHSLADHTDVATQRLIKKKWRILHARSYSPWANLAITRD